MSTSQPNTPAADTAPVKHYERIAYNAKGIFIAAPQEYNPRKRPWGLPASPAGGPPLARGDGWAPSAQRRPAAAAHSKA